MCCIVIYIYNIFTLHRLIDLEAKGNPWPLIGESTFHLGVAQRFKPPKPKEFEAGFVPGIFLNCCFSRIIPKIDPGSLGIVAIFCCHENGSLTGMILQVISKILFVISGGILPSGQLGPLWKKIAGHRWQVLVIAYRAKLLNWLQVPFEYVGEAWETPPMPRFRRRAIFTHDFFESAVPATLSYFLFKKDPGWDRIKWVETTN